MPWIRTQNKKELVNCDTFIMGQDEKTNQWMVACGSYSSEEVYLGGMYSSEEKTFKVLDLIEAYIFSKERGNARRPFQFPLDDEVKI